jgi:lipopolysaccharide/colanic/teichoic acid biosynthesis glycosyltransferase
VDDSRAADAGASGELDQRRREWQRRQRGLRRAQDIGLALLALGVLVLVYVALAVGTR